MYTIRHDGRVLFDPRLQDYPVQRPKLTREANRLGTVTFTIYPGHPEYDEIKLLTSEITVYLDGVLIFSARPVYKKRLFRGGIEWCCEELAARLNDFVIRPFKEEKTITGLIDYVLAYYNSRVTSNMQIQRGNVLVTADTTEYVQNQCLGCWDTLIQLLVLEYNGYLVARYTSNGIYLDYLREEDLPLSGQSIKFGENLVDLFLETDAGESFSVLIPQGATSQIEENNTVMIRYTDISSVNDGLDYIESAAGIALFGRREAVQYWPDISEPADLLAKAQEYLDENAVKFADSVTLTAADMHNMDANVSAFRFLDRVLAESPAHELSKVYPIEQVEIPLGDPENANISLGRPLEPLTERIAENEKKIKGNSDEFRWVVGGAGLYINKNGVWQFSQDTSTGLGAVIAVTLEQIEQIVTGIGEDGEVTAASIVAAINAAGSEVVLSADHIYLVGYVTANELAAQIGSFYNATTGTLSASWVTSQGGQFGGLTVGSLNVGVGRTATWQTKTIGGETITYLGE